MGEVIVKLSKNETDVLDNLSAKYQDKNYLCCGRSRKPQPAQRIIRINDDTRGTATLIKYHLGNRNIQTSVDNAGYLIALNETCQRVNNILRGFFARMVEVKEESERIYGKR